MQTIDKIKITCSDHFLEEKRYVFDVLFNELLEIEYNLELSNIHEYVVSFRSKKIIIKDSFFSALDANEKYFNSSENIPQEVKRISIEEFNIINLPVLFGDDGYSKSEDKYVLGVDIIASAFYMLSRWEEYAIRKRDQFERFPEKESLAIKNGFNKRPVVNEYANLLSNCLLKIGFKHAIKREYRVFITHDIDDFARYDKFSKFIKALVGDIVKRHSIRSFFITLSDYFKINLNKQKDVYNTFDFLMNKSDEIGVKSRFYFIPGKIGESDVRFDIDNPKVIKTIKEIEKRGHIVGIHPGFETLGNREQLFSEVNRLRRYVDRLEEGRQHYLRVKLPVTLNDWSDAGLKIDSSLGFYSTIGFRSGICQEYEIFDFIERQKTGLIERPLLVMDTALRSETNTKEEFVEEVCKLNQLVKEFSGDFVLLWHNSNLLRNEWYNWDKVYQEILNKIKL